jgi:cyclic pyranopterin phosphate synthase
MTESTVLKDTRERRLRDLRISVTDRCNFRCTYCMPKAIFGARHKFMQRADLLSFEEITRLSAIAVEHGVRKIRITGGEPLIRRDLEQLLSQLAALPGLDDLSLTTNGSLLSRKKAQALADAGLNRITLSLDSLDDDVFMAMNDVRFPVDKVLAAVDVAEAAGLSPVKLNMVVKRGVNESDIVPMARRFHGTPHIVRFIEFMDVGTTNGWRMDDVMPAREIVQAISSEMPLVGADGNYGGEVAQRWKYVDGGGEVGVISSVTQPFCGGCTRARLSAEGKLYTCLFASSGHDMRKMLRDGASDDVLAETLSSIWRARSDNYSELRSSATVSLPRIEMSYIGG